MFVYAPQLVRIITGNFARAIALYPFVFVSRKEELHDPVLVNHEKIHLRQQRELLVLPFYFCYLLEYLRGRLKRLNHYEAYRQISFEQEAFAKERDLEYLKERQWGAFRKYLSSR
ncbi:MAG: hypothetical protein ACLFT3_09035 [Cyclobacteriaceae bacterium]